MNTEIRFPLFGKEIVIGFDDVDEGRLAQYQEAIVAEALRLQKIFNFYDEESELSRLNRERSIFASPELLEVTRTALTYCELSGGKYDITQGAAFLERKKGVQPRLRRCTYKDVIVFGENITLADEEVMVDLGSIAKGYIADRLKAFLIAKGFDHFFIDARGDLLFYRYHSEIGIQDSRGKGVVHEFSLENGAVATSGDYLQYVDTYEESHLLGGREYSSVTVIHDSLMLADVLATVTSVSGKDVLEQEAFAKEALFILDKHGQVARDTLQLVEVS